MISAFMASGELHAVHVIHQKGLTKIQAIGLCTIEEGAGAGVYQVPDWAFDDREKYVEIPICAKCSKVIAKMKEPPRR